MSKPENLLKYLPKLQKSEQGIITRMVGFYIRKSEISENMIGLLSVDETVRALEAHHATLSNYSSLAKKWLNRWQTPILKKLNRG